MTQIAEFMGFGVAAIVAAAIFLIRKLSSDKLALAKDRAEENLIQHLSEQRDRAISAKMEIKDQMVQVIETNSSLIEEMRDIRTNLEKANAEISLLRTLVNRLTVALGRARDDLRAIYKEASESSEAPPVIPQILDQDSPAR